MEDNLHLMVIQIWAALAWADGVVVPAERLTLRRLVASARELDARERARAMSWLDHPVALTRVAFEGLDADARAAIYRAAVGLAAVDGEVHESERSLLVQVQSLLELDAGAAARIEDSIIARA